MLDGASGAKYFEVSVTSNCAQYCRSCSFQFERSPRPYSECRSCPNDQNARSLPRWDTEVLPQKTATITAAMASVKRKEANRRIINFRYTLTRLPVAPCVTNCSSQMSLAIHRRRSAGCSLIWPLRKHLAALHPKPHAQKSHQQTGAEIQNAVPTCPFCIACVSYSKVAERRIRPDKSRRNRVPPGRSIQVRVQNRQRQPDQKAPRHIRHQRAIGEPCSHTLIHPHAYRVAAIAPSAPPSAIHKNFMTVLYPPWHFRLRAQPASS